jgi:hypothetical protein
MVYFFVKCILSGLIIAVVSEVARRSPSFGALIVSLPLCRSSAFSGFGVTLATSAELLITRSRRSGTCYRLCPCFSFFRPCFVLASAFGAA